MPSVPVDYDVNSPYSNPQSTTGPVDWVDPTTGQYTGILTDVPLPYTPGVPIDAASYTPPAPVSILEPTPAVKPATINSAGSSIDTLTPYVKNAVLTNPAYLQGVENLDEQKALALKRIEEDRAFWLEGLALQQQALKSSGSGGGAGASLAAQEALDRLEKEKAARQMQLSKEAIREHMAARGLTDSGQAPFEQGELKYQYDTLIKQIDLQADARRAAAAAASSEAASQRASQLASLDLQKREAMTAFDRKIEDAGIWYANEKGKLVLTTGEALAQAWFDPNTGYYNGPGGELWDKNGRRV